MLEHATSTLNRHQSIFDAFLNQISNMAPQRRCCLRTSLVHNVLSALSTLQNTKGSVSIKLTDLVKYMECTQNMAGDVRSQVESALNTAQDMNYVLKTNERYALISPAARLHLVPPVCLKEELKRIQEIFDSRKRHNSSPTLCNDSKRKKSKSPMEKCRKSSVGPCKTRSKSGSLAGKCPPKKSCPENGISFLKNLWPAVLRPRKMRSNCTNTRPEVSCSKTKKPAKRKIKKRKSPAVCPNLTSEDSSGTSSL